jgi:hypothetical protein
MNFTRKTMIKKVMASLSIALFIVAMLSSYFLSERSGTQHKSISWRTVKELSISSNDFCFSHQFANCESIQNIQLYTLQSEKLLRSSIFDYDITRFLTLTQTWFVLSPYRLSLSPKWCPSIHIAHRRLVI